MADDIAVSARQGFAALYQSQRRALVRLAARLTGDSHAAEDIAQDAYLRAAAFAETGGVAHLQPFLFQTARNLALDHLRRQKVRARVHSAAAGDAAAAIESVPDPAANPERLALNRERIRRFEAALAKLPERARQVLVLHRLHGLPQVELAARFGVTERTISKDLALALRHCLAADSS